MVTEQDALPVKPKVLVVDDEPGVLESIRELLRREFEVFVTSDPAEAVRILEREDIAVVLTDQRMPKTSGVELLARSARLCPETVRVLFTGYSDIEAVIQAINEGRVFRYVAKPWDPDELLDLVRECTGQHGLAEENIRLTAELASALESELLELAESLSEGGVLTMEAEERGRELAQSLAEREVDRLAERAAAEQGLVARNAALQAALDDVRRSHWMLRRVQELLPVCSYCGKVRTGEGRWQTMREYLNENADFLTHGVCPDCLAALESEMKEG